MSALTNHSPNLLLRKIIKWGISPLILVAISIGTVYYLDVNKPIPEERPTRIKQTKVFVKASQQISAPLIGYSQGQVLPKQDLELRSEVAGKIVFVSENLVNGGKIQQGEKLVQIDPSEYQLTVIQRQSKVAQAEQQLAKTRAETLAAQQELSDLGRENPSDLALGIPQLRQAEALLAAAKADLQVAELALSKTNITAPFDGRVESETLTIGQYINRGGLLAQIHATDLMEVRLPLNPEQLTQIGLPLDYYSNYNNSTFEVSFKTDIAEQTLEWQGKVIRVEATIDDKTRSLYAVAEIPQSANPEPPLIKGLFVNAQIQGQLAKKISALPKIALRSNEQLWIVDNNNQLQVLVADIIQRTPDSILVKNLPDNSYVITSALAIPTPGMPLLPIFENGEVAKKTRKKSQSNQPKKPNKKRDKPKASKEAILTTGVNHNHAR